MFSNAKVGDKVWSPIYGWGKIVEVTEDKVVFMADDNNGHKNYCWIDKKTGKYDENDINPAIYWQEFEIPPKAFKKPMPDLKVDTKVLVWNGSGTIKFKRYFSHFTVNGNIACFSDGKTSWSSEGIATTWDYWELAEENKE